METTFQDIRFGLRMLTKNPGFTIVALLTLALGIGANTAIFSIVNAIVFRPLPYAEPQQLVGIWTRDLQHPATQYPASLPALRDWQQQTHELKMIAAYAFNRFHVSGEQGSDETRGVFTTPNFFSVMGVVPKLGRVLEPSDEHSNVVVLSDELWHRRYNGSADVIGKSITLNAESFTIVGVMPGSFRFPTPDIEVWTTLSSLYNSSGKGSVGDWINNRNLRGYRVVGRLREGASIQQAQSEMTAIAERLAQDHPDSEAGTGVVLIPLREQMVGTYRRPLIVLLVAVAFILLIACANVANLIMTRTAARDREIAVRRAMGAGQMRLIRQMLTESFLLSVIGGGLGLLFATWGVSILLSLTPKDVPRLEGVSVDRWTLLFTLGISTATGLLFGLAPAWHARTLSLNETLREGGRGVSGVARVRRMRSALVVSEIALAVVLLIGSGLMLKSFQRLNDVNPGFAPERLMTMAVSLQFVNYQDSNKQLAFFDEALKRIRSIPGVAAAGACTSLPPNYIQQGTGFTVEGRPIDRSSQPPEALYMPATPGFLEALGVPIIAGRNVTESDRPNSTGVVVINQALAKQYFPNDDPLVHRLMINDVPRQIVGVAGNVKYEGLGSEVGPQVYVPYSQSPFPGLRVVVKTTTSDPLSLLPAVRDVFQSIDRDEGPTRIASMEQLLSESVSQPRFNTFLIGLFAVLALVLAIIGIYGVMSYDVAQRTGEIGIRVALGAQVSDIMSLMLGQGAALTLAGLALGILGALALTRFLKSLLFEVAPHDFFTFVFVSVVIAVVAMVACYVPSRRATKVDPLVALRHE